ncbi:MAG: hypothetical protein WDN45_07790 [Caulobacteraceae bacterium]
MNKKILTGALAALTLGGAMAATTTLPAAAADHRGGWHGGGHYDRGWHGGGAGAALLGLSVGAALAGGYAAPAYYPPAYYSAPRCRVEMRWNAYWGGYDRVRVCY